MEHIEKIYNFRIQNKDSFVRFRFTTVQISIKLKSRDFKFKFMIRTIYAL